MGETYPNTHSRTVDSGVIVTYYYKVQLPLPSGYSWSQCKCFLHSGDRFWATSNGLSNHEWGWSNRSDTTASDFPVVYIIFAFKSLA